MANKWDENTGWAYADWSDEERNPLMSFLWDSLKASADERVSFGLQQHSTSYLESNIWPDFNTDQAILNSGDTATNSVIKCKNSAYPKDCMKTSEIVSGTTINGLADVPDELSLSDVLDELGYATTTDFNSVLDTNSGTQTAIAQMAWVKQWFEVMDYPVYFNRLRSDTSWVSQFGRNRTRLIVRYTYNQDTSTFISAEALFSDGLTAQIDLYNANDLNETAPFSTPQDVRDYAITLWDANYSTTNFATVWNSTDRIGVHLDEEIEVDSAGEVNLEYVFDRQVVRFKPVQEYRAQSPNRYDSSVYFFGAFWGATVGGGNTTWSDFSTGNIENESDLDELTADGSGWYYLDVSGVVDWDTEPVLTVPATPGVGSDSNIQDHGMIKKFLTPGVDPSASGSSSISASVYFNPNLSDGSAWEYYTP